jgi:hypothetical protein
MRVVGLVYVLPTGEFPLEIELARDHGSTTYWLRMGTEDAQWASLSDSKRWNAVYLYATGEHHEQWTWSEPVSSCLTDT